MKDKEVGKAIESIRALIASADERGNQGAINEMDFRMKQAQIEATLLLARVIQERPLEYK